MSAVASREETPDTQGEARTASRTRCPGCSSVVLEAPLRDGVLTVLLEVVEVLVLTRCPTCLSSRQRYPAKAVHAAYGDSYFTHDQDCPRCGSKPGEAGYVGEVLSFACVALSEDGTARPFVPRGQPPEPGEAIHRAHLCGPGRVL